MPGIVEERKHTIDVLVKLVDEDFQRRFHLPKAPSSSIYVVFLGLLSFGAMLFLVLYFAGQSIGLAIGGTFFIGALTMFASASTFLVSSHERLQNYTRNERLWRIEKKTEFKNITNEKNHARNEIILCSLITIASTLPVTLQEIKTEIPEVFTEERLMRYLLE